jgi:hypothetical protein
MSVSAGLIYIYDSLLSQIVILFDLLEGLSACSFLLLNTIVMMVWYYILFMKLRIFICAYTCLCVYFRKVKETARAVRTAACDLPVESWRHPDFRENKEICDQTYKSCEITLFRQMIVNDCLIMAEW